ncbi:hypothetical protein ACFLTR_03970 [Chloroflexota bacterium]
MELFSRIFKELCLFVKDMSDSEHLKLFFLGINPKNDKESGCEKTNSLPYARNTNGNTKNINYQIESRRECISPPRKLSNLPHNADNIVCEDYSQRDCHNKNKNPKPIVLIRKIYNTLVVNKYKDS